MTHAERVAIVRGGHAAIRSAEGALRAHLAPASEDAPTLRLVREAMSLADRIELALEVSGGGEDDEIWRDLAIAGLADAWALELLAELERRSGAGSTTPRQAMRACRELLGRYRAGEFHPPPGWEIADVG